MKPEDVAAMQRAPSRSEALNEKVTWYPPVKEQMPHQSNAWHRRRYGNTAHAHELTDTENHPYNVCKMPKPTPWE